MARWAALQPASALMPPPGARGHDEVGILQELSDLLPLVLRRCKAVATELCGVPARLTPPPPAAVARPACRAALYAFAHPSWLSLCQL